MSAHPLVRRVAAVLLAVSVGWAGSWLGLTLLSGRTFSMGPFRVRLSAAYGRGVTDIAILPLGRVTADTHRAPLHVTATLQSFSVSELTNDVRQATNRIEDFRAELEQILDGAVRAYTAIPQTTLSEGPQIRVLHISDIHLNPLGLDFAKQVAEGFDVNFVIDTGDLTSFGTPAEQLILSRIPAIGKPYVFVRGNHDSMALQEALTKVPNARVLDGTSIRLSGFTIYGLGDPAFTPDKQTPIPDAVVAQLDRQASDQIAQDLDAVPKPPDMILVHDDRMAESAAGRVPLVLSGHFHQTDDRVVDGTLFLRIGS